MVEVTQADRDVAARYLPYLVLDMPESSFAQAFAAHREAAYEAGLKAGAERAVGDEDALLTIYVLTSHHPNELNTTQTTTKTHLKTGPKANPLVVWGAIQQAIAGENAAFVKYHRNG